MNRLSERGGIQLGFRCNARCGFCYYQDLLDNPIEKEPTTKQLLDYLRVLRSQGATEVEFTGGEPTIRSDLIELIKYAKKIGFVNVSVITNGLRLANPLYADDIVKAGVNDFLFSIHGHTGEIHEEHTSVPGSFFKILDAIRNIQSAKQRCRSTTTVTGKNYLYIEPLFKKLIEINVQCIHLAVFSPVAQAMNTDKSMFVSYSKAAESIKRAIDRYKGQLPLLSVKYIPFCFMKGYENYVMNLYQQSFDPDDWNYYYSNKVRRANTWYKRAAFDVLVSMGSLLCKDFSSPAQHRWQGIKVFGLTRLVEILRKKRPAVRRDCKYDIVCDHVWKDYIAHFGDSEITPVFGPKVKNPVWCYDFADYRMPGVSVTHEKASVVNNDQIIDNDKSDRYGAVLITGASSGIGRACAIRLDQMGFTVFAGVRREEDGNSIKKQTSDRLRTIQLDINIDEQILNAVATVTEELPQAGFAGLINNAGIAVTGPLECVSRVEFIRQLEVNVVSQIAVTQAFLPLLRRYMGRIINISSISGRIAGAMIGPYCASKFAFEAVTDSLALELNPFGIKVSVIEPGVVNSPFWKKLIASEDELLRSYSSEAQDIYKQSLARRRQKLVQLQGTGMSPEKVSQVIANVLVSKRPKARYVIGLEAKLKVAIARYFPEYLWRRK